MPNLKTEELIGSMQENELHCEWLSLKYEVELKTPKIDDSFKMYVRLRHDSAVWVSATYYAVEVARFLFTPDSVKFMDRKNNQFYIGDYSYISDRFGVDASYDVIQSIILGNALHLLQAGQNDEKLNSGKEGQSYFLTQLKKRQIRKAMRKEDEALSVDLNVSVWVSPEDFRINKTQLDDFESGRTLIAEYTDFKETCNSSFPYKAQIVALSANEQAEVKTSVMKLTSDKKVSLSFTIPDKYEALVP